MATLIYSLRETLKIQDPCGAVDDVDVPFGMHKLASVAYFDRFIYKDRECQVARIGVEKCQADYLSPPDNGSGGMVPTSGHFPSYLPTLGDPGPPARCNGCAGSIVGPLSSNLRLSSSQATPSPAVQDRG